MFYASVIVPQGSKCARIFVKETEWGTVISPLRYLWVYEKKRERKLNFTARLTEAQEYMSLHYVIDIGTRISQREHFLILHAIILQYVRK